VPHGINLLGRLFDEGISAARPPGFSRRGGFGTQFARRLGRREFPMSWLTLLWIAAIVIALVAITGIKPRGTRHVARTHLMTAARVTLGIVAVVLVLIALGVFHGGGPR